MFEITSEMIWPMILLYLIAISGAVCTVLLSVRLGVKRELETSFVTMLWTIFIGPVIEEFIFRGPIYWVGDSSSNSAKTPQLPSAAIS